MGRDHKTDEFAKRVVSMAFERLTERLHLLVAQHLDRARMADGEIHRFHTDAAHMLINVRNEVRALAAEVSSEEFGYQ